MGNNYKIKISKDYDNIKLYKGDLYIVDYKLLQKCSLLVWKKLLKKDGKNTEIIKENDSIDEEELDYIFKNKDELE